MNPNEEPSGTDRMAKAAQATPEQRAKPDLSKPSPARMYDYYLGGKDNFAVDRAAAEKVLGDVPEIRSDVCNNRGFVVRAVRFLAEQGIDQFIDLGTGIPTSPNVHETVRAVRPDARVVYVDNDPIVTTHTRAIRATRPGVVALEADVREPEAILAAPVVTETIDLTRPVAIIAAAVLHFVDDAGARHLVDTMRAATVPGSYLAASTISTRNMPEHVVSSGTATYQGATSGGLWPRSPEHIATFFDGYELVEPGLVPVAKWRADDPGTPYSMVAGVGRRTGA